jgi:hypothetical protein
VNEGNNREQMTSGDGKGEMDEAGDSIGHAIVVDLDMVIFNLHKSL